MVKSRRHRSRKRSRKRRGGLAPSDIKECKAAGVGWAACAGHLAKAKLEASKAKAASMRQNIASSPTMAAVVSKTTAAQDAANKLGAQAREVAKQRKGASTELKDWFAKKSQAARARAASVGGKKRRRKSRKLKKRRKSKSKRRRKHKSKRKSHKRKSRKTKRRKRRKSRKSRSRRRRR